MDFDDIVGIAMLLYFLSALARGMLRRSDRPGSPPAGEDGAPGEAAGDGGTRRPRTWEEELRELFEEAQRRLDLPPWAEPGPLPEVLPEEEEQPAPAGNGAARPERADGGPVPEGVWSPPAAAPYREEAGKPAGEAVPSSPWDDDFQLAWEPEEQEPGKETPAPPAVSGAALARPRRSFHPAALREAVVMMEVMGPPRALRPYRPPHLRQAP